MNSDVPSKMDELRISILRDTPAWKKLGMAGQMFETVKTLTILGVKRRHPQATDSEIRLKVMQSLFGEETAKRYHDLSERK